jgi:hypothetical protein
MSNLGDIRKATSSANASAADFQRALKAIRALKIKETQRVGKIVAKRIGTRFSVGQFAGVGGKIAPLGKYGNAWRLRKIQLKLDLRRGVARKGILKQVSSGQIFAPLADGFDIDIKRPALIVTGNARLGKRPTFLFAKRTGGKVKKRKHTGTKESFFVNDYIDHYANAKAPGLGLLSTRDLLDIQEAAQKKVQAHLNAVKGAAQLRFGKAAATKLTLKIGKVA